MVPITELDQNVGEASLHIPVMFTEVIEGLNLREDSTVVDCTLGLGQHSQEIVKRIGPSGRLIGIDRDRSSLELVRDSLKNESSVELIHDDYRNISTVLSDLGIDNVDGILFDLGISSYQLDNPDRGFSFRFEGPLDMRMDRDGFITAYDLVNSLSEKEISDILHNYGQERFHRRIARAIVQTRSKRPIETTQELSDIVFKAMPMRFSRQKIHPATRTFQALRIAVNRELEGLDIALNSAVESLKPGGRICVIAFHSLEDRIVKENFRKFAREQKLSLIVKKPLRPSEDEVRQNARARSARLRIAERT